MMAIRIMIGAIASMLAACDLGIGSDPASGPPYPCQPGNVRTAAGCFVPHVGISIDGTTADWSTVEPVTVAAQCLAPPCEGRTPVAIRFAAGGRLDFDPTVILVEVAFDGAPPQSDPTQRVALALAASPARPAIGGVDRVIVASDGVHYEKNGFEITTPVFVKPYSFAFTPAGFEAAVQDDWLPHQGAALVSATIERFDGATWLPVAPIAPPLPVCWTSYESLGPRACEVPP